MLLLEAFQSRPSNLQPMRVQVSSSLSSRTRALDLKAFGVQSFRRKHLNDHIQHLFVMCI
jgi:hypothetical protein